MRGMQQLEGEVAQNPQCQDPHKLHGDVPPYGQDTFNLRCLEQLCFCDRAYFPVF